MSVVGQLPSVEIIIARYPLERESLIPVLQDVQAECGYLAAESIAQLAAATGISENEIFGVASFFTQFRFRPPAKHSVTVCLGTACHVRGGAGILSEFENHLRIKSGEATEDGNFDLQRVACIGCCALAPVVVVDGDVHARVVARQVRSIVRTTKAKRKDSIRQ